MNDAPLILTLRLADEAQARFDRLRALHFPPERNLVPAHVTLFHHLPGAEADAVRSALDAACAGTAPFAVEATGLRSLGRGVAYELHAPELPRLRAGLARVWTDWLTPQDRQGFRPHVTVQNKVAPERARALLADMQAGFAPFAFEALGLRLWRYLGGPWEAVSEHPFAADAP